MPKYFLIYYYIPKETQLKVDYIKEILNLGLIRPSKLPIGYPVLFIYKKNTEDIRFYINY